MKILVLVGGESAEREVSLNSGKAIVSALQQAGHEVLSVDAGSDRRELELFSTGQLASAASAQDAQIATTTAANANVTGPHELQDYDCVFIGLHGGTGEDGTLQALLDLAGIRYTGSGARASAIAMDKYRSKLIFKALDIPTPEMYFFGGLNEALPAADGWPLPLVVKPNAQGSTVGLSIVRDESELRGALELAAEYDREILIEKYIPGREITVAILGDEPLPVVEIIPKSGFYDYRAKYTAGESEYVCPAVLAAETTARAQSHALTAFKALGCAGYARVDFRLDENENLYCLELNTLPGMTATSLVPKAARAAGLSFGELLQRIIELATSANLRK
ncbi:MAG: D-alanine--D-alanine ligase [bacterium]